MRSHCLLLTLILLLGLPASAQRIADIQKLPLLHDPTLPTPKQVLTPTDKKAIRGLLVSLNQKPQIQEIHKDWPYSERLDMQRVLFTIVAPFRSAEPERLTVFQIYESTPPVLLLVLSGQHGMTADVVEPIGNLNICVTQSGYSLRDIDHNGRREVAFVIGCGDGPSSSSTLHLFDYFKASWRPIGALTLEERMDAYDHFVKVNKIYVRKGKTPQIYSVQAMTEWPAGTSNPKSSTPKKTTTLLLYKWQPDKAVFRVKHLF